jgi:hypothetical protein
VAKAVGKVGKQVIRVRFEGLVEQLSQEVQGARTEVAGLFVQQLGWYWAPVQQRS